MPKRFHKHKLLLDENLSPRTANPHLNSTFDVKHVQEDLHLGGLFDPQVYEVAVKQQRTLLTSNIKHFRSLAGTKHDAGIIGISSHLSPIQVDTKLMAFLRRHSPTALSGKLFDLTGETEA
jgi:predicted nuclease of predicted toxin-antitoxin system